MVFFFNSVRFVFVTFAAKKIYLSFRGCNCVPVDAVGKPQGLLFGDPMIVVYVSLIYELTPTRQD